MSQKQALGPDWNAQDLVFPTATGHPMQGSALELFFHEVCLRSGITASKRDKYGFRIHGCRHTAATHQLVKIKSLKHVADMLGHSTTKMTEKYLHLIPTKVRQQIA
jgi:integrase